MKRLFSLGSIAAACNFAIGFNLVGTPGAASVLGGVCLILGGVIVGMSIMEKFIYHQK